MPELLLGPMLRYVDEEQASVWVETDAPCEVMVLGRGAETFCIQGHHYGLVMLEDLEPGSSQAYEVRLDGELRWPEPGSELPPSLIRTVGPEEELRVAFGSCRVTVPHEPPYDRGKTDDPRGRGGDALRNYALRMIDQPSDGWPQLLFMLGDQVYADEVSPATCEFIRSRRDITEPPWEQVADFEEYTRLYREAWSEPIVRWLLSTVGVAMLFDDHDVHDDWNISIDWLEEMRSKPWWHDRITGALVAYWVYQHLGNVSPKLLSENDLLRETKAREDAWPLLEEWAEEADRGSQGRRWSYSRTIGRKRFVFMDSREGRVLGEQPRRMFDDDEWDLINERVTGNVDHLVVADTLPVLLPPAMHDLEAWNEAVCDGAWGAIPARLGEKVRQGLDLEHWGAFQHSFRQLTELFAAVGAGERGAPPASIVTLGGDIHHAYLAEVAFRRDRGVKSPVWQAVCSPYRNPLDKRERRAAQLGGTRSIGLIANALARAAGVPDAELRWRLVEEPTFDNQIGTLTFSGRHASLRLERATPGSPPSLQTSLERRLA
ncbi:MAG: alkaline phosphatase family protein [Actinomycetota bacterium]|nr:alkaline phosphatase family protein [Actinomycetota bacterium]